MVVDFVQAGLKTECFSQQVSMHAKIIEGSYFSSN